VLAALVAAAVALLSRSAIGQSSPANWMSLSPIV